jgi:small subunit ribosomal protein S21
MGWELWCHQGGEPVLIKVERRDNESFSHFLRRFRKRVTKAKVLSEARKKRFFVSKSEQRRIAKKKAIRKMRRKRRN